MKINLNTILKLLGFITFGMGIAMLPSIFVSLYYGEHAMLKAFAKTIAIMLIIGLILIITTRKNENKLRMRDGVIMVALCWIWTCALGSIPYLFSDITNSFVDAFFESTSGFTTTGATIISDLGSVPKGLIFWRSLTQWIGGMGILVFVISILPALGIGGQNIAKAETTGPTLNKIATRISDNAKILYIMYVGLSIVEFILLLFSKMGPFDAMIHTFGSMGTSGLSHYTLGIAHFDSVYIEVVISVFCILASVNFIAYNHIIQGRARDFFKEPEVKAFFMILLISILVVTIVLRVTSTYDSILTSLRHGFFQVASFMTTTGYVTDNYSYWPLLCRWIMFALLFIGGCSASTSDLSK